MSVKIERTNEDAESVTLVCYTPSAFIPDEMMIEAAKIMGCREGEARACCPTSSGFKDSLGQWKHIAIVGKPNIEKQVCAALETKGYSATVEHPGYVAVTSKSGIPFACGTANGQWDCNRDNGTDGGSAEPFYRLNIPQTEASAEKIAAAIIKAIEQEPAAVMGSYDFTECLLGSLQNITGQSLQGNFESPVYSAFSMSKDSERQITVALSNGQAFRLTVEAL